MKIPLLVIMICLLTGCVHEKASDVIRTVAEEAEMRQRAYCIFAQVNVQPWGHVGAILGKGGWDCIQMWEDAGRPPL